MEFQTLSKPFPHIIGINVWSQKEQEMTWLEIENYKVKLNTAEHYGGVAGKTNALAISYTDEMAAKSSIVNNHRNLFFKLRPHLINLQKFHYSLNCLHQADKCHIKLRYYEDEHEYKTHTDMKFAYLVFSYFNKEPKRFNGGELYFEDFDYEFKPKNNSLILIPGYIAHGVRKVNIEKPHSETHGRYCISMFVDYTR